MSVVKQLQELKEKHELPNSNDGDYNRGYVAAMNKAIHLLKSESDVAAVFDLGDIVLSPEQKAAFEEALSRNL